MENAIIKSGSAYNLVKLLMGFLLMALVIFWMAFLFFSQNKYDTTARLQQNENVIAAMGNITDRGVTTVN